MKKIFLLISILAGLKSHSQTNYIQYDYDANGNRSQRLFVCGTCRQANGKKAAPTAQDTAQSIAVQKHGVNVFPNPTQDKVVLSISNLQDGETPEVIVTDETGKTLYTAKNLQAQNEINMANYNTGTYFVRLMMGKDVMIYKVMKIQ